MPYANTDGMSVPLVEISRHVSPGAHAILVVDGAGWHSSRTLVVPANITLLTLPPYSLELNPVENIWQYLRQNRARLASSAIAEMRCIEPPVRRSGFARR